jgi:hypothetical protein
VSGDAGYRRTQIAWPAIVGLVPVGAIIAFMFARAHFLIGLALFGGVWAGVLLLFSTLTVTVKADSLVAAFGIGLVRKRVRFADVTSFEPVRNPWYYGWGIHLYPRGAVYNASGLSAIEFRMSSGRYVRIGTPEPEQLTPALEQAMGRRAGAHESIGRAWGPQHLIGLAIGVLALALAGWTLYVGFEPPAVGVTADSFSVKTGLYSVTVPYSDMRTVTLEAALPRIALRTNGFAAGQTLRGNFVLDEWGRGKLFINRDAPPFLVVRTAETFVAVNFKDPEETRALYSDLTSHIDRIHR